MDISIKHSKTHTHWSAMSQAEKVIIILRWTFALVPIIAGADKFMHLLANWDNYLAPLIAHMLPMSAHSFMNVVGVIEIIAGVIVLLKPRIGSLIVGLWLIGIAINLLLAGYYDVAVRDAVMAVAAFCLHMLTREEHVY